MQQQNARAVNKIGLSKHVQKNRNEASSTNNSLVMSAPRVVALASHQGLHVNDAAVEKQVVNMNRDAQELAKQ